MPQIAQIPFPVHDRRVQIPEVGRGYEQPCALEFPERDTTIDLRLALPDARYRAAFLAMVEARGRLPVEAAADLNCLSPSRFSHDFRARLGRPFRDVQFVVRMELTAHTLLRTHWRLSEIADAFGYSELKHWDAAFARHFGVCPCQYRARFTSEADSFKDYCRFFNYSRSTGNSSSSTGNK